MRKRVYSIFTIIVLLISSMSLAGCSAITAQNINSNGFNSGMNGGPGINSNQSIGGAPGMNGGPVVNGSTRGNGSFNRGMMNADLIGKIIYVNGNSLKIEVMEQVQSNNSSNFNNGNQNVSNNQNNRQSQRGFTGTFEMKDTGTEKTLTVSDGVNISQQPGLARQNNNDNSNSTLKLSDLKEGQIIMIWYKENTETVERISVVQS